MNALHGVEPVNTPVLYALEVPIQQGSVQDQQTGSAVYQMVRSPTLLLVEFTS